ncbi:KOW domain-containing RNA-binding protein [Paenibacillus sp. IB182496]|uniref:KOW domain-containing RNA-binding protein n=1 Tax=Paenibacillus sabuli TaxID=2772509 RepID=A0A927BRR5_9BACL|nr:KOW domain-containing RNA-binding protein [Paenibacillus sabuli]MBD2844701.1 KOW domain-containing RNA-binding protein [Paenibacillus sabuli]
MFRVEELPALGQVVQVTRGKDEGTYAVVIGLEDDRLVWIADGHKRRFAQPKRKNRSHLELLPYVSSEVADSLRETGSVTNGKLRYAIAKYLRRKGE